MRFLIFLITLPCLAQPSAKAGLTLADFRAHDPCILADSSSRTYYLYIAARPADTGQNRSGVLAYKSKDLRSWEGPKVVFTVPNGLWANPAHGLWAPEVHAYNNKYYLFATLMNNDIVIEKPPESWRTVIKRGTQIFVGDSPEGPFQPFANRPIPPEDFSTLDGTLFIEDGTPYMVYAHEWVQVIDGTMEAIPLKSDLSEAAGEPFYLFKASDAPWLKEQFLVSRQPRRYVSDGPFLYRTKNGKLLMIWSSWKDEVYVQTVAVSQSGKLRGSWRQSEPLLTDDTGHGMIFHTFDGRLMLVAHSPTMSPLSRTKLFELEDTGDAIKIKR
jgi:GH43 family beta-xylosidase